MLLSKPKLMAKKMPQPVAKVMAILDKPTVVSDEDEEVPPVPPPELPDTRQDWHLAHSIAIVGSDDEDMDIDMEAGCKTQNT